MELALWTYEGPPHVGAMRIATSMRDVHYVIHAPQGDTYADLLFTMIERGQRRPPITYTTFQARDLGDDTAGLVKDTVRDAYQRFQPAALMVGESCTAELLQDQPGALASKLELPVPVVPLELPAYSKKENWGASESFYYLVRHVLAARSDTPHEPPGNDPGSERPTANLLGLTSLGFRCRDDVTEVTKLLDAVGIEVNVVAPLNATVDELARIPEADFNICLCPEVARTLCRWLARTFQQPTVNTVPIGIGATLDFLREIETITGIDVSHHIDAELSRLPWYSRSIDSTYLTGKRVFIFGDGSHVMAAARMAREELGFEVVGMGTFSREMAREVKQVAQELGVSALITDDYLDVEASIQDLQPELVLGTQMERHVAKRLGIPCAVISAPVHVQDFPARYSPQMGFEGANVIFDTWVHPLTMGLEEHLLHMFRDDFEFNDTTLASHLHTEHATTPATGAATQSSAPSTKDASTGDEAAAWTEDAEQELKKIPFFVRGKARRNTELYAQELGEALITIDTLYEAKAHYAR